MAKVIASPAPLLTKIKIVCNVLKHHGRANRTPEQRGRKPQLSYELMHCLYIAAIESVEHLRRNGGDVLARSFAVSPTQPGAVADQHVGAGGQ